MGSDADRDDRPVWAHRIRGERLARGWSQLNAVDAMRAHSPEELPARGSLLRNWKRWEAGDAEPDEFYRRLIAKTFGTVTAAFFHHRAHRHSGRELLAGTGLDTLEVVLRLRASDVAPATLEALRITADRLCSEYPYLESEQLYVEGLAWLRRITMLLDRRLTLAQHREVLTLAGTVALLVGCVEYDLGRRLEAEATRKAAFSLGEEADNRRIMGWAQEMKAWFALTRGNLPGAVAAAKTGESIAPRESVAVQLAAQRAKASARMGDRREVEFALDHGRSILESSPQPEDLDHHFVVDPAKFDFYAMDCYRILGENERAELYAREVIRSSSDLDGTPRKPMRIAEAKITLGVVAARSGNLEEALVHGREALQGNRKSLPSLTMVSQDLATTLTTRYPKEPATQQYLDELHSLAESSAR